MSAKSRIVLLNGVGSAGKTTIAKDLQKITHSPFLYVAMDGFLEMLPEVYQDHAATFRFEPLIENGHPSIAIHTGPIGERVMSGMRAAIAALAGQGNDLIVDDVLVGGDAELADYRTRLAGHRLLTVGVHAPLDVLEAREKARGDRLIGLARWQFPKVHAGMTYDLEVDTSRASPEACARAIRDRFEL